MSGGTVDSEGNRSGDSKITISGDIYDAFGGGTFEVSDIIYTTNSDGSITANIVVTTPDGASYTLTPTSNGYKTTITNDAGDEYIYNITVNPGLFDYVASITDYNVKISVPDGTTDGNGNFTLNGDGTYTITGLDENSPIGNNLKISDIVYIPNGDGTYTATVTIQTGKGYTLTDNGNGKYTATIIDSLGNISNYVITIDPGLINSLINNTETENVINNDATNTIDNTTTNIIDNVTNITDNITTDNISQTINVDLNVDNIAPSTPASSGNTSTSSNNSSSDSNSNDDDYTRGNSDDENVKFQKGEYIDLDSGQHNLASDEEADAGYTEENIFANEQQSFDTRGELDDGVELSGVDEGETPGESSGGFESAELTTDTGDTSGGESSSTSENTSSGNETTSESENSSTGEETSGSDGETSTDENSEDEEFDNGEETPGNFSGRNGRGGKNPPPGQMKRGDKPVPPGQMNHGMNPPGRGR